MASTTSFTDKGVKDGSVRTRERLEHPRRAVAARILATLSANERLKSSALNAEEYEKLSRQSRTLTAGHSQTTRVCEDQHGQLQSAQTRTQRTCAGDADDKYAAGCTRRPWRH